VKLLWRAPVPQRTGLPHRRRHHPRREGRTRPSSSPSRTDSTNRRPTAKSPRP